MIVILCDSVIQPLIGPIDLSIDQLKYSLYQCTIDVDICKLSLLLGWHIVSFVYMHHARIMCLQCFDAVGWAAGVWSEVQTCIWPS